MLTVPKIYKELHASGEMTDKHKGSKTVRSPNLYHYNSHVFGLSILHPGFNTQLYPRAPKSDHFASLKVATTKQNTKGYPNNGTKPNKLNRSKRIDSATFEIMV